MKNYGLSIYRQKERSRTIQLQGTTPVILTTNVSNTSIWKTSIILGYMPGKLIHNEERNGRTIFVIEIDVDEEGDAVDNFGNLLDDIWSNNLLVRIWSNVDK
jgi:hypothetical protein